MSNTQLCKLSTLAEVAIGYQHRERVLDAAHGTHLMIQARDVTYLDTPENDLSGWRLQTANLDRVTPRGDASRYRIEPGDVLFVSRGASNIAVPLVAPFVEPMPQNWDELIPAYIFYILRPDRSRILPEYLAWFINQPPSQAYLARHSRGSLVKLLPKAVFEELEVSLPPIEVQQKITELDRLRAHEESLLRRLITTRQQLIQQTCLRVITGQWQPQL